MSSINKLSLSALLFTTISQYANAEEYLSAFPAAKVDEVRWVIQLPKLIDADTSKVEIYVGKQMVVDCNQHSLTGEIKAHKLSGWGFNYYHYEGGQVINTLMRCPDNNKREDTVYSQPKSLPYNSRLPIVVYTPKDMQVSYRILTAGDMLQALRQ